MAFADFLAADADAFLADFGRTIIYRPHGGAARSILAIPIADETNQYRIWAVKNDDVTGISSAELDKDRDQVDVALREGETAKTWHMGDLVGQDEGMITFEVR